MPTAFPQIMLLAIDLHERFVEVPPPLGMLKVSRGRYGSVPRKRGQSDQPKVGYSRADIDSAFMVSPMFRNDSGNLTYIITANWMLLSVLK